MPAKNPAKPLPFPGESPTVSLAIAAGEQYGFHEEEKPQRESAKPSKSNKARKSAKASKSAKPRAAGTKKTATRKSSRAKKSR
jgi:hypothetical protein